MESKRLAFRVFALGILGSLLLSAGAVPSPAYSAPPAISQAQKDACIGAASNYGQSERSGLVNLIATPAGGNTLKMAGITRATRPESAARGYLSACGALFGLRDQAQELQLKRQSAAEKGSSVVKFQQSYRGVPVIGGELNMQLDADNGVQLINGEVLPDISLVTAPRVAAAVARATALGSVSDEYQLGGLDSSSGLAASTPELWIYEPELIGYEGPTALVWRIMVTRQEAPAIRQLVLVDAQNGAVLLSLNQLDTARNRMTYDLSNLTAYPGTLRCDEANASCVGGDTDEVNAHIFAGDTYDFYRTYHGRDSINNAGMALNSHVHYAAGYCNAFWDGSRMTYGDGCQIVVDDVVAHEMTHGVTQYESGLIYANQSGAINESFSDIWGELVDLTNTRGNDTASVRWLMGEDTSIGAIRNMKDPPTFSAPDRMGSPHYYQGSGDNGGVHINSGVGNKAAYLIVDGDTFNGYTIAGIGIAKAAKIFYKAQTDILTSSATYANLGAALTSACNLLVGTDSIVAADCDEVRKATYATEMVSPGPAAPSGLAATPVSQTRIDLTWTDNSNDESGFKIERKTGTTGAWAEIATAAADATAYSDNGATAGTVYYYRVRAYNALGASPYSNETTTGCAASGIGVGGSANGALATTDCQSTLRAGSYSDSYSFAATAGTTYVIALSSTAFDAYLYLLNGTTVLAYDDDSAGNLNSRIVYTATASGTLTIHATSYSPYATGAYALTLAATLPPTPPSGLTARTVSADQIDLTWTDNSNNETGFRIERRTGTTGAWEQIAATAANATGYSNGALAQSTAYCYRASAYNANGVSAYSNESCATTPACTSSTTGIGVGSSASGTLATSDCRSTLRAASYYDDFTFAATAGTTYVIALSSTAFDAYLYLRNGTAVLAADDDSGGNLNSRIVYTATASGTLTIHATSYWGPTTGAYAVTLAVASPPTPPSGLTATPASLSQINLAWTDNSNNETGFRIERKTGTTGVWAQIATTAANATSYGDGALAPSTAYCYRAQAYNAIGLSGYSNEVCATTPACGSSTTGIGVGSSASGTLATTDCRSPVRTGSYYDSFTFAATAGTTYVIELSSTAFDAYLYLRNGAAVLAADDDSAGNLNSRIVYTATTSGTLTIHATSFSGNATGAYTVAVNVPSDCTPAAIAAGTPVNGTLAATDCRLTLRPGAYFDVFGFNATAGTTYTIALNSSAFDAYLYLLNDAGALVASNDDSNGTLNSRIVYTATTTGTLRILATSFSPGATGAYTLTRN